MGMASAMGDSEMKWFVAAVVLVLMIPGGMCWALESIIGVGTIDYYFYGILTLALGNFIYQRRNSFMRCI
jgi:hypothetical protein